MSEIEKNVADSQRQRGPEDPVPAEEKSPEKQLEEAQLSPRRRSALVTYLAILFAVAFLFVALMMVMEAKRLKTMNQELQDSSQKTSASLTNNINALQAENQQLSQTNEELTDRIRELEAAAAENETQRTELQAQIDSLTEDRRVLNELRLELEEQLETLTQKAEDAVQVSELLHKALAADEAGDMDGLWEILDQIEPLKELLSPTEQEIYEELKIA